MLFEEKVYGRRMGNDHNRQPVTLWLCFMLVILLVLAPTILPLKHVDRHTITCLFLHERVKRMFDIRFHRTEFIFIHYKQY
jgi:hypothetical protein